MNSDLPLTFSTYYHKTRPYHLIVFYPSINETELIMHMSQDELCSHSLVLIKCLIFCAVCF